MDTCTTESPVTLLMDAFHRSHHAKMIAFGVWNVPAYYTSIIDEHTCVRTKAGLFDITHMGEISITGPDARSFIQRMITNDLDKYPFGTALYSVLCNETGGIIDDLFVYPVSQDDYFLVVNASNCDRDYAWLMQHKGTARVTITNRRPDRGIFALQGPASDNVLSQVLSIDTRSIGFHTFRTVSWHGTEIVLSASGYTGERGFELLFDRSHGERFWEELCGTGSTWGLQPIGFGARDTLRLEAGCPLYGHEMNETITPWEANAGWIVKLDKPDFVGKSALLARKQQGVSRKIFGLCMQERAVPRDGYTVWRDSTLIGKITSGSYLPTLDKNGALALLESAGISPGTDVFVEIRGKKYAARIVPLPFYRSTERRLT